MSKPQPPRQDTGAHYRHTLRVAISPEDVERGFVEVKLDPYRICALYQVGGGPQEHIAKKALRGTRKGSTPQQLVNELRDAVDRWQELIDEDNALSSVLNTGWDDDGLEELDP